MKSREGHTGSRMHSESKIFGEICMNLGLVLKRRWWLSYVATSIVGMLLMEPVHAAQESKVLYMVALNPDASRVAIAKWQPDTNWEIFESAFQARFQKLRMPDGHQADSSIVYSPDGKYLLFTTTVVRPVEKLPPEKTGQKKAGLTTLWRKQLSPDGELASQKVFEGEPVSNVLPLTDGSFVFLGKTDELKSLSWSPITGGHRVWSNYKWMLRKPDGTVSVINPREYAFFATASLIRDEAVFFMQQRYINGQAVKPKEFYLDITKIKPDADLTALERLGNMQDGHDGPRLQCDWAGTTCVRRMTFNKNGYYAHQLELIRGGKVCRVEGLPDRIERMAIARSGNAVALITRPNPYKEAGYQLARITVKADGCAGDTKYLELP
jgi:hypothetical protein